MSSENRTSVPNSLNEHWMPFTSNKDFKANPRLITEAKGVYLKTHFDQRILQLKIENFDYRKCTYVIYFVLHRA